MPFKQCSFRSYRKEQYDAYLIYFMLFIYKNKINSMNFGQLTEVKKGQTGTGLLIENDGCIDRNTDLFRQIHEDIENNHKFVIPEHFVVSAIFQKYGIKNANGRIYPESILKREVDKYQEKIASHNALGSLDHPSSSAISGHDISHNILSLEWKGNTLVGQMELQLSPGYIQYGICSTSGDLVANMLLSGYLIGVSSRGVGSVKESYGQYIVCDDYEICCWDVVIEPSTPGAYIKKDPSELEQYVESDTTKKDKPTITENSNLTDIENILYS